MKQETIHLGILGGGQLARMLALSAHRLGIVPHILSENKDDPAAQVTANWQQGSPHNKHDLKRFANNLNALTLESEFISAQTLREAQLDNKLFPNLTSIETFQDRLPQKIALKNHRIPTAEFEPVSTPKDIERVARAMNHSLVFKRRTLGYDGYGTYPVFSPRDLQTLLSQLHHKPELFTGWIAERRVRFKRELAFMMARSKQGVFATYPLVQTQQVNSRCLWVKGPIVHPQLAPLKRKFQDLLNSVGYVGIMGIELFEEKGKLLVNEVAPRVHNSGHYTMDAFPHSQFDLHLLCGLSPSLPPLQPRARAFAMANLLGDTKPWPQLREPAQTRLHWYGKVEVRPGRKMGHLNTVGTTPAQALHRALQGLKVLKKDP